MPTVRVSPKIDRGSLTHDVSLSAGGNTIGLLLADESGALTRYPVSEPAREFTETQTDWTAGLWNRFFRDDVNGFMDSYQAWTMTPDRMLPGPQWNWGTTVRTNVTYWPGDVGWKKLISVAKGGSHLYIAIQPATAITAADSTMLIIRQVGRPGTLTFKAVNNSGGDPTGSTLQTVTATSTAGDWNSQYKIFDWTGTQNLNTTDWIYVYGATTDNEANHWEIGVDTSGSGAKISDDGSSWSSGSFKPYFRVMVADLAQRLWYWTHDGSLYCVNGKKDATTFSVYINGDRGTVTSAGSNTLTDTNSGITSGWTTDEWKTGGASASADSGAWVRIISGPGKGQARQITANTSQQLTVSPAWDKTPTASSNYVIYKTPKWTALTGHGGSAAATGRPATVNQISVIPQGDSAPLILMNMNTGNANNHAWVTCTGFNYDYVVSFPSKGAGSTRLYAAVAATAAMAHAAIPASMASFTSFTGVSSTNNRIGTKDTAITSLTYSGGKLFVGKEDGLWWLDGSIPTEYTIQGLKDMPGLNNCKAVYAVGEKAYIGYANSAGLLDGTNFTDIMNYKQGGQGIPANRRGYVSRILQVNNWILFAIDGGTSNYSSVLVFNGIGWHELWRGWATGVRVQDIFYQPCPGTAPRIWIDAGGEPVYFDMPFDGPNPVYDSTFNYAHEGSYTTGIMDIDNQDLYKLFHEMRVVSENLTEKTRWIEVDFQRETDVETSTWYRLGTAYVSPLDIIPMDIGETTKCRFRIRSYTTNNNTPPILYSADARGLVNDTPKYMWLATCSVGGERPQTLDRQDDFTADYLVKWLNDAHDKAKILKMNATTVDDDLLGEKGVVVSAIEVAKDSVRNGKWTGRISLRLQQP